MITKNKVGATVALLVAATAASGANAAAPAEIVIPGEKLLTESLTSSKDGSVYVGSILGGTIFRAKPGAATAEVLVKKGTEGMNAIFGVFADDASNTLWACSGNMFGGPPPATPPPPSSLYAFDLKTGAHKGHWPFPTAGASCNDIAVDARGNAYATDTTNMEVVRLSKGGSALDVWSAPDAYGPKGGVLDGIAVLGDRVVVNTLATSKLFATLIGKDGKAGTTVELKLDRALERPDGQRSFGKSSLLVVEGGGGGRLSKVEIKGDAGKVTTIKEGFPDGPVGVTVVGTTAYVLEAQFASLRPPKQGEAPAPVKPYKATAVAVGKP